LGGQRVNTLTSCEPTAFWEEAAMTVAQTRDEWLLVVEQQGGK